MKSEIIINKAYIIDDDFTFHAFKQRKNKTPKTEKYAASPKAKKK